MELYDSMIKDKYYDSKRKLKRLLNELQTADDIIQVSHIHTAIDDVICDLVSYKINDVNFYRDERARRNSFYQMASSFIIGKIVNKESEETDGKKT